MISHRKILMMFFGGIILLMLAGCAKMKTYFPDKEKDYRYSVEIPELDIPPDLSREGIESSSGGSSAALAQTDGKDPEKPKKKAEIDKVRLLNYAGGASRLQLDEPFDKSWRIVGKAISHQSLEIVDRNRAEGIYYVQYDPDAQEIEDGSLWDELVFFFGKDKSQEKEYHIRLVETEGLTEVFVLDKKDKPLSKDAGLKLLNLLLDTIKADFAED
ncbi:MAG: outer membrane protein assembly factor BamC [Gammaproteobacteria bacterium]